MKIIPVKIHYPMLICYDWCFGNFSLIEDLKDHYPELNFLVEDDIIYFTCVSGKFELANVCSDVVDGNCDYVYLLFDEIMEEVTFENIGLAVLEKSITVDKKELDKVIHNCYPTMIRKIENYRIYRQILICEKSFDDLTNICDKIIKKHITLTKSAQTK